MNREAVVRVVRERGGGKRVAESPNLYEHAPIHTRGESSEMLEGRRAGSRKGGNEEAADCV